MKIININDGLEEIIASIEAIKGEISNNIVISVIGGTSTGKTSMISIKIKGSLSPDAVIKSQDNYYYDISKHEEIKKTVPDLNYDHRESIEMSLYERNLYLLKDNQPVKQPKYDFLTTSRIGYDDFYPKKVIITEGLFPVAADIKIFVNTNPFGMIIRRLIRDRERSSWSDSETLRYLLKVALPMHEQFTFPAQDEANFIIDNNYDPYVEAKKIGVFKRERVFDGWPADNLLRNFVRFIDTLQIEKQIYSQFQGRKINSQESYHILKIQKKSKDYEFTYEGPDVYPKVTPYLNFPLETEHVQQIQEELGLFDKKEKLKRNIYNVADSEVYIYLDESSETGKVTRVQLISNSGDIPKDLKVFYQTSVGIKNLI